MIYFAINDKIAEQKQKEVEEKNNKIIENYNNLSFWKKLFINQKDIKIQIWNNWRNHNLWLSIRMRTQN